MLVFLAVWARGAEWFPYNAFRMFAGWTPRPIFYERYVTADADGTRGRNFHYHELNPVLNRKRLMEGLEACADDHDSPHCADFLAFALPRAERMEGAPDTLVVQTRAWDFVADIDSPNYCDAMNTLTLDVRNRRVTKQSNLSCDQLDLRACCASTIGTI